MSQHEAWRGFSFACRLSIALLLLLSSSLFSSIPAFLLLPFPFYRAALVSASSSRYLIPDPLHSLNMDAPRQLEEAVSPCLFLSYLGAVAHKVASVESSPPVESLLRKARCVTYMKIGNRMGDITHETSYTSSKVFKKHSSRLWDLSFLFHGSLESKPKLQPKIRTEFEFESELEPKTEPSLLPCRRLYNATQYKDVCLRIESAGE